MYLFGNSVTVITIENWVRDTVQDKSGVYDDQKEKLHEWPNYFQLKFNFFGLDW